MLLQTMNEIFYENCVRLKCFYLPEVPVLVHRLLVNGSLTTFIGLEYFAVFNIFFRLLQVSKGPSTALRFTSHAGTHPAGSTLISYSINTSPFPLGIRLQLLLNFSMRTTPLF